MERNVYINSYSQFLKSEIYKYATITLFYSYKIFQIHQFT